MMAECRPSPTGWVKVTEMSFKPAWASWVWYSARVRAPAMQPTQAPRSARSSGVSRSSATTSVMPMRPPGLSTRKVSANTAGLSTDRLTTQLEMTTSTVSAGRGMASIWPLRNSTLVAPAWAALRRARASISSVMSSP